MGNGGVKIRMELGAGIGTSLVFAPEDDLAESYEGLVRGMWLEAAPGRPAAVELQVRPRAQRKPAPAAVRRDAESDPPDVDVALDDLGEEGHDARTPRYSHALVFVVALAAAGAAGYFAVQTFVPRGRSLPVPVVTIASAAPTTAAPAAPTPAQAHPVQGVELPPEEPPPPATASGSPPPAPSDVPAAVPVPAPSRGLRVTVQDDDVELLLAVEGKVDGLASYPLAEPTGIAVELPAGRASLAPGTYAVDRGDVSQIWVREPTPAGQQIRIFFTPLREAQVTTSAGSVRIVIPALLP